MASNTSTTTPPRPRRFAVVSSSTRDDRMSPSIADWAVTGLRALDDAAGGIEVDLIDLAEVTLPDDRGLYPGGGAGTEATGRVDRAEGFVIVTPEYNHSYPASLKRFIDWHYSEWMFKPVTVISYGVLGGQAATEHLRGVFAELNMVTTRRAPILASPWTHLDEAGAFTPDEGTTDALAGALSELAWWADVLTDARTHRPFTG